MNKIILDYELKEEVGRGAFSQVFRATRGQNEFAVKILKAPPQTDLERLKQAMRYEFWVLKDLSHANIVKVFDFGSLSDDSFFLVEELLAGPNLKQFCRDKKFPALEEIFLKIFSALSHLHAWKLIHRDVKPENILVSNGEPKLLDFGLAIIAVEATPEVSGTAKTLAPEIILGQAADERSDLYSTAVTLYESLTGQNPFLGKTIQDTLNNQLKIKPKPIATMRDDVPQPWSEAIARLMSQNPLDRYPSCEHTLALIKGQAKHLFPGKFVGRKEERAVRNQIEKTILAGKKFCLSVQGEKGCGVSRFLKEIFYTLLYHHPDWRTLISFDRNDTKARLLLLERQNPPAGFISSVLKLQPLTKEDVNTWLHTMLACPIPGEFLDRVYSLTQGNAEQVITLISLVDNKAYLRDATGTVTPSSLKLVPWKIVFPDNNKLTQNFDYLLADLKERLRSRTPHIDEDSWRNLEKLAIETKDKPLRGQRLAHVDFLKGVFSLESGRFDEAITELTAAKQKFAASQTSDYYRILNYIAYANLRQGRVQEAIATYEAVREQIKTLPPSEQDKITNLELGAAYLLNDELDKAIKRLTEEKIQFAKKNDAVRLIHCAYNLALAQTKVGELTPAKAYYEEVIRLARTNHDPAYLFRGLNGLGNVLKELHAWQEASSLYGQSLEVALAIGDFAAATAAIQNRATVKAEHGLHWEAIADLEKALSFADNIPQKYTHENMLVCRALEQLGGIYAQISNFAKADEFLNRAWQMAQDLPELAGFRFWVLLTRCRVELKQGHDERFKEDLAQLTAHAKTAQQKILLEAIKQEYAERAMGEDLHITRLETELTRILHITAELVAETDINTLLKKVLNFALELSRAELGVILLADDKGRLIPRLSVNAALDENLTEISQSVAAKVRATGQVVMTADAPKDVAFNQFASVLALNLKSILGIPIHFHGVNLGVLYLSHRLQIGMFDERSIRMMQAFADQVGLALKNNELLSFYKNENEGLSHDLSERDKELSIIQAKLKDIPDYVREKYRRSHIITVSAKMFAVLERAEKIAASMIPVVIQGESGVGKELIARFIHEYSVRRAKPFIAINCGALPATLVESELFGHRKGAFTGALRDKIGLIEAAHGGTLFLDEVTDLAPDIQVKLLRVLQEREFYRLGETRPQSVDVRVIAASHKLLTEATQKKTFREDLYYRLAGLELHIPSLRERPEDIPELAQHFLKSALTETGKERPKAIDKGLSKLMMGYSWPGNARELKNVVDVGVGLTDAKVLKKEDLPQNIVEKLSQALPIKRGRNVAAARQATWYDPQKTWTEHELIIYASALIKFDFDVQRTATSLGVGMATVYQWLRENRIKELRTSWEGTVPTYEEGLRLRDLQRHIFTRAAARHPGHPYRAARELNVAPVTFYRWAKN